MHESSLLSLSCKYQRQGENSKRARARARARARVRAKESKKETVSWVADQAWHVTKQVRYISELGE